MFRIGQLVHSKPMRYWGQHDDCPVDHPHWHDVPEAGIVTYVGIDGSWVSVNWEDRGEQVLIPFNMIEPTLDDLGRCIYYG